MSSSAADATLGIPLGIIAVIIIIIITMQYCNNENDQIQVDNVEVAKIELHNNFVNYKDNSKIKYSQIAKLISNSTSNLENNPFVMILPKKVTFGDTVFLISTVRHPYCNYNPWCYYDGVPMPSNREYSILKTVVLDIGPQLDTANHTGLVVDGKKVRLKPDNGGIEFDFFVPSWVSKNQKILLISQRDGHLNYGPWQYYDGTPRTPDSEDELLTTKVVAVYK